MVNSLVFSWITIFVEKHIAVKIICTDIVVISRKDLEEIQPRQRPPSLHEGNDSVSVYFNKLKTLWDNLDSNTKQPTCTCGFMKEIKEEKEKN